MTFVPRDIGFYIQENILIWTFIMPYFLNKKIIPTINLN